MVAALSTPFVCPHCGGSLVPWEPPPDCAWTAEQRVCLNDECPYYVEGWAWMEEHYGVHASYRYRLDPATGHGGPLPVNSPRALKDIVRPAGEEDA
jgi:hypothetical protein